MVNIQSITVVSNTSTKIFNSTEENWAFVRNKASTSIRQATHDRLRKLTKLNEKITAVKYNIEEEKVKDAILVFGTSKATTERLKEENIRELLFNKDNKVVVVIIDIPPLYQTITTVHTSDGQEQIVSTTSSASQTVSRWEL